MQAGKMTARRLPNLRLAALNSACLTASNSHPNQWGTGDLLLHPIGFRILTFEQLSVDRFLGAANQRLINRLYSRQ